MLKIVELLYMGESGESTEGLASRIKDFAMEKIVGRVPEKKIDYGYVVRAVNGWRGNPLRKGLENNPFTTDDIMDQLGYTTAFADDDPYRVYPKVYELVRSSLQKLANDKILSMETREEPDWKGEFLYYTVKDKIRLNTLAIDSKNKRKLPEDSSGSSAQDVA